MNGETIYETTTDGPEATFLLGQKIGKQLRGGEVIELRGDLGAGKTQLVRGIASGAGSNAQVQSPSFTIMREYPCPNFLIKHYDFYRLDKAHLELDEIAESVADDGIVSIIEWAQTVQDVLPEDRTTITISANSENGRDFSIDSKDIKI